MFLVLYDLSKCVDLGFEPLPAIDTLAVVRSRSLVVWFLRSRWLQIQDALSLKDDLSESWSVWIMLDPTNLLILGMCQDVVAGVQQMLHYIEVKCRKGWAV